MVAILAVLLQRWAMLSVGNPAMRHPEPVQPRSGPQTGSDRVGDPARNHGAQLPSSLSSRTRRGRSLRRTEGGSSPLGRRRDAVGSEEEGV